MALEVICVRKLVEVFVSFVIAVIVVYLYELLSGQKFTEGYLTVFAIMIVATTKISVSSYRKKNMIRFK